MEYILEDVKDYEIFFINQNDTRPFNRGAMKNFGFKYVKDKYPQTYKDITLVFNDVDTMPAEKGLIDYETTHGVIKHYYGFDFCLGGIFSIKAGDFEKINGFPNYWTWGLEDNTIYYRAKAHNIHVDRSVFYKMGSMEIIHSVDELVKFKKKSMTTNTALRFDTNGIDSLNKYIYEFRDGMVNINTFDCMLHINKNDVTAVTLKSGNPPSRQIKMGLTFL
jgi:hypothetical protein